MDTQELYKYIGRMIRKLRTEKGWTQEYLACKADISLSFLGHIERGTRKLSVDTLYKIARELECSSDELIGSEFFTVPDSRQMLISELDYLIDQLQSLKNSL